MRIEEFYNTHGRATIYIIGTGPSLRCMNKHFFLDEVTIGLNQSWKYFPTTYNITVHPELAIEQMKDSRIKAQWFIKKKPPMENLEFSDKNIAVFNTTYDLQAVKIWPDDTLYLGEGVQTTAIDLASRMGARNIILVGCDGGSIAGDCHGHNQHVRWLGLDPEVQYKAYRDSTAEVREILRPRGISVYSLTPFISVVKPEEDYSRLVDVLKLEKLDQPKDVSPYKRNPEDIRTGKRGGQS